MGKKKIWSLFLGRFLATLLLALTLSGAAPQRVPLLDPPPPLDLNFVNGASTGSINPLIAFSRPSTASYFNSSGLLSTAASGAARIDYDPVALTPKGLLIEESRTNLALQSNQFDTSWTKFTDASLSPAAGTSPDGTNNAWKLFEGTTAAAQHSISQNVTKAASALPYTFSVFAKVAERTFAYLQLQDASGNGYQYWFNLSTGAAGTNAATGTGFTVNSATVQALGNVWYRLSVTATSNTATTVQGKIAPASADGTVSYAGTVGSGILIYGAQLEQASFATSYIPTTTASVTRSADVAAVALSSTSIPANPMGLTIIGKARTAPGFDTTKNTPVVHLDDGTTTNRIGLRKVGATTSFATLNAGPASPWNADLVVPVSAATDIQFWLAEQGGNSAAQLIGQSKITNASMASLPSGLTTLRIGSDQASVNQWNSTVARLLIYTRRLPDAQAAAIAASQ